MFANAAITAHAIDRYVERIGALPREEARATIREGLRRAEPSEVFRIANRRRPDTRSWKVVRRDFAAIVIEICPAANEFTVVTVIRAAGNDAATGDGRSSPARICRGLTWTRGGHTRVRRWKPEPFEPWDAARAATNGEPEPSAAS